MAGVPRYRALFEETRGGLEKLGVVFLIVGNGIGLLRPGSFDRPPLKEAFNGNDAATPSTKAYRKASEAWTTRPAHGSHIWSAIQWPKAIFPERPLVHLTAHVDRPASAKHKAASRAALCN